MTTLYQEKKQCAVCGGEHEYPGIGSTNAFGSPDLDTRPPEMRRSTIFAWVHRCPECGYCASDISKAPDKAESIVRSTAYQKQLSDPAIPELANSFLCMAIIDEAVGELTSASWSRIHAAWMCDDEHKIEAAKECRCKAVDTIQKARKAGQKFMEQRGAETAILVDLLRRSGRFSEAKKLIETKRAEIDEEVILKVLNFQELLLNRDDIACHTIAEALWGGMMG